MMPKQTKTPIIQGVSFGIHAAVCDVSSAPAKSSGITYRQLVTRMILNAYPGLSVNVYKFMIDEIVDLPTSTLLISPGN
jgi:hypothetical protein